MWSKLLLCLLVGLAYASNNNPAWKDNNEYVYQVRGRTLTSLEEISDDYSGVLLKAKLTVYPKPDGTLYAKISDAQTSQLHAKLPQGWESEIPESQLAYKPLELSHQSFKIEMRNGVVSNLIVNKDVPNWEANIIKSIVSQIQLDTKAENMIASHLNAPPQEDDSRNDAVYKTMEDTVTGISETLYEIHPMPEYVLQSQPWLAPLPNLKADGELIEVVKSKNYSHSEERPAYHYGFTDLDNFEPNSNQMGQFFTRSSISRAVLTGTLNRYTVQNSYTINKIIVSPTLADKQKGFVNSKLNITLQSVQPQSGEQQELSNPVALGSLVYRYNSPYSASNEARQGRQHQTPSQREDSKSDSSSSEEHQYNGQRPKRSLRNEVRDHSEYSNSMSDNSVSSEEYWQQEQRKLNEAPESPLLPLNVGYQGQSIKKQFDVKQMAEKLALQIGEAMQDPTKNPIEETVGKFVALTSVVRTMNEKEMQETAAKLYSKEQEGNKREAWVAFRDAVAQAGTGPALLLIQDWIKTQKIQRYEAGAVVASAADAARQPTEEYMRSFYQMITVQEVMSQKYLNESALFAFTKLAHNVYVNKEYSHNKYPSHSFGGFRTENGKRFLKSEVIPQLAKKLQEAVERADTEQIHVYIRALGNVGHQQILSVFEPYLEGKKQVSQFQRLLMVLALDKLVKAEPKLARSVLYKIYQNPTEKELVRAAAVYQLMRTAPAAEMLQRMASYTHEDTSECVNAAVQSAINTASELRGAEFKPLRSAAESAKHLLTKKQYGLQYSQDKLRSYAIEEMNYAYKQSYQTYGSDDSFLPSGIQYNLRSKLGGVNQRVFSVQAIVSSIDDLTYVAREQTEEYKRQQQQQEKTEDKWSSEYIAKLLNIQNEDREQLEGYYFMQIESLQKMISFDNRTIENLPRALREYERALKNGHNFHHTKMVINNEMVVSFPTETGLPFIYTYDEPNIVRFHGKVQAEAKPEVSNGKLLKKPDTVDAEFKVDASITYRTQSQLGFVTPNDHQRYSAGYDKNFQAQLPIRGKVQVDMKKKEIKAEIQTTQPEKDAKLMHFSTVPYTSKDEIFSLNPKKQVIRAIDQHHYDQVIGDKSTGIAFELESTSDRKMDAAWLYRKMQKHDPISALMSPWADENIQYAEINAKINSGKSHTDKVNIYLSYDKKYKSGKQEESNDSKSDDISEFERMPEEQDKRKERFMRKAAAGIHSVDVAVVDAQVEFHGPQEQIKYRATAAAAKSDADPKSRVLFYMQKRGNDQRKPFSIAMNAKSHIPNTNGLNLDHAMDFDPTSTTQMQLAVGENYERSMKFDVQVQARKSEERKGYLKQEPLYRECQRQMQKGNTQLPTCAKMTARANLLDEVDIKIQYDNIQANALNATYKLYSALRQAVYPKIEENIMYSENAGNKMVHIEARFEPDMPNRRAHVSIKTQHVQMNFNNIEMSDWFTQVVVPHPVFNMRTRLAAKALRLYNYRPMCVVDKHAASTFDNKTFPIELHPFWTLMLQYVPRRPSYNQQGHQQSVKEQLEKQVENYNVLVRASKHGSDKKDVRIYVKTPETQGKHYDVTMEPGQKQPKVTVNGKEVQYEAQQSTDVADGAIKIYALPSGEVKVEVHDAFYVIFDGVRVKLTVVNGKFRNSIRGLCGSFTDEKDTDFEAPNNCILRDPKHFLASYTVLEQGQENHGIESMRARGQKGQCYRREYHATNVVSDRDAGRRDNHREPRGMCTKHQTRYTVENGQICFTLRPIPVCKSECQQRGTVSQNIPVHCVAQSNVADLWKKQIDKGASPDFSLKSETKTIRMEIPQSCSQ